MNSYGNLFGGTVLAWLDEAGALYVREKIRYENFVTVGMDDVYFKNPGKKGDTIKVFGKVTSVKQSSIQLNVRAYSVEPVSQASKEIIACKVVYACLGEDNKPFPYFFSNEFGRAFKKEFQKNPNR